MAKETRSDISRRDFISAVAAAAATLVASLTGIFAWFDLFATAFLKNHLVWPAPRGRERLEREEFLRLSRLLTGHVDLDLDTGAALQSAFEARPGQAAALVRLYERVRRDPQNRSAETLRRGGFFARDENRSLASGLVAAWYTGIVEFEGQAPVVVTYFDALMHRSASGTPLLCPRDFGAWAYKEGA